MGMTNLTTLVAAQTAVDHHRIGVATSTIMLFRTFGAAFAVSLMGTVMLGQMQKSLSQLRAANTNVAASALGKARQSAQSLGAGHPRADTWRTSATPDRRLGDALWYAFLTGFVLMIIGVAVSFPMANYTPATTPRPAEKSRV